MNVTAGVVVDGFRLEKLLHAGGMATIWRVTRDDVPMPMVMKIPLLRHGEDPATIVSFEVEQMILPRLASVHVPRFVAAGDFDAPYIVMEEIAGRSIRTRLDDTPLSVDEVAGLGARIARALDDIHGQRVIHHDVKPSNVIVRPDGQVALIDFGLSRHDDLPDLLAEEFHVPVGTGAYISPEQLVGNRADRRSDFFGLGVVLYFLATGERPFGDPTRASEWRRRLWRDPVPPRRLNAEVPPWLQEIILRCLALDPNARHPLARELADDLEHPESVRLTSRATRMRRDSMIVVARRRVRARDEARRPVSALPGAVPIVMAAIDFTPGLEPLGEALRVSVRRVLEADPHARLACVNVLRMSRLVPDEFEDSEGRSLHLRRLAKLERWARPLGLTPDRVTYHVLESTDPAAALLEYARSNRVDHIVMGARASSTLRRYLGSVSSQVVAEAPCTVTVVRLPDGGAEGTRSSDG